MKRELPCANLSVTDIIKKIGDQTLIYSHNKKVAYQYADPLHSKVSSADRCFIHKKSVTKNVRVYEMKQIGLTCSS